MNNREATRVLRKRSTYVNQELQPWHHLAMLLCPQAAIYRSLPDIRGTVLEVGFGTGSQVMQYAHKANWVTATEIELKAVEWARKMWPLPNVEWCEHDICESAEFLVEFDTILCIEVLEHVEDPEQALRNLGKALKPGGVAWISVPRGRNENELHQWAWDEADFESDLSKFFQKVTVDANTWPLLLARCEYA